MSNGMYRLPELKKVSCGFCNGSGHHPDHGYWSNKPNRPCPVCSGRGFVKVSPDAEYCAYCKGKGIEPWTGGWSNSESQPCSACGGSGVQ